MAKLKEKAKARVEKKNGGNLAGKAKARSQSDVKARTVDEIEREEELGTIATPITTPSIVPRRPPLPPALAWLRKRATIPALRQGGQ